MVLVLQEQKVDFDLGTKSEGITPLMIAAQREDCDVMIAALLNVGADPKIVDYNSESALHWLEAAGSEIDSDLFEQRRREARQDLVNYGARLNVVNSRGVRPDDIRAMWNHDLQPEFDPEPISEDEGIRSDTPQPDSPESDGIESDLEMKLRTYGRYEELDYYMERIVEIQQQINYISKA